MRSGLRNTSIYDVRTGVVGIVILHVVFSVRSHKRSTFLYGHCPLCNPCRLPCPLRLNFSIPPSINAQFDSHISSPVPSCILRMLHIDFIRGCVKLPHVFPPSIKSNHLCPLSAFLNDCFFFGGCDISSPSASSVSDKPAASPEYRKVPIFDTNCTL